ncbi:MAG: hypothetical protein ABR579_10955 [Actinomycetota bacterium]
MIRQRALDRLFKDIVGDDLPEIKQGPRHASYPEWSDSAAIRWNLSQAGVNDDFGAG